MIVKSVVVVLPEPFIDIVTTPEPFSISITLSALEPLPCLNETAPKVGLVVISG